MEDAARVGGTTDVLELRLLRESGVHLAVRSPARLHRRHSRLATQCRNRRRAGNGAREGRRIVGVAVATPRAARRLASRARSARPADRANAHWRRDSESAGATVSPRPVELLAARRGARDDALAHVRDGPLSRSHGRRRATRRPDSLGFGLAMAIATARRAGRVGATVGDRGAGPRRRAR